MLATGSTVGFLFVPLSAGQLVSPGNWRDLSIGSVVSVFSVSVAPAPVRRELTLPKMWQNVSSQDVSLALL